MTASKKSQISNLPEKASGPRGFTGKFQNFKFIILLGRSGSGKGTQAELLKKKFSLEYISTGNLLRKRIEKNDFVAKKLKAILDRGGFVPTPSVFQLWMPLFENLAAKKNVKGLIFDGSPRKLYEAYMLDELLELYGWHKQLKAFHIKISEREAMRRLLNRGRADDKKESIKNRLHLFKQEVVPVLKYYKQKGILVDINGEQSVEAVHQEILRKLKTFLAWSL